MPTVNRLEPMPGAAFEWAARHGATDAEGVVKLLSEYVESRGVAPWAKFAGVDVTSKTSESTDFVKLGILPATDTVAHEFYKKQQACMWAAEELKTLEEDRVCYPKMSPSKQRMYKLIVGFFHAADAFVTTQVKSFSSEANTFSEEAFLAVQEAIEFVHQEAYSLAALVIGSDSDRDAVAQEVSRLPCVRAKWDFITKHRSSTKSLGYRYLAAAFAEGVFFAGLFAMVYRFKFENLMPTFCTMNDWISRDEFIHRDFNAAMVKRYGRVSVDEAHALAREALAIEVEHAKYLLSEPFESREADERCGLTVETLTKYAESLVDQVLVLANMPTLYGGERVELPWMGEQSLHTKGNFYETTIVNYAQISVSGSMKRATGVEDDTAKAYTAPVDVDF